MRAALAAALLAATPVWAQAAALIDKAERELRALEYQAALKSIDAALAQPNNDRATLLKLYELQAVSLATLGQEAKALRAFQSLFSLSPEYRLEGNHPPRVNTVYFEARGWVGQHGGLAAQAADPTLEGGKVKEVRAELRNDPLKLAREVRFHLRLDGREEAIDAPLAGGAAAARVGASTVTWWAELLGERKSVLLEVVSANSPRTDAAPQPAAPAPVARPDSEPVSPPRAAESPSAVAAATPPVPGSRVAGLVLAGAGLAAAGAGIGVGVMSAQTRASFEAAERDADGKVIGLTQREALALDARQRTEATVGNVLMIAGGALAATGVVVFAVSFVGGSSVAVSPAGAGAVVSGTFP